MMPMSSTIINCMLDEKIDDLICIRIERLEI